MPFVHWQLAKFRSAKLERSKVLIALNEREEAQGASAARVVEAVDDARTR